MLPPPTPYIPKNISEIWDELGAMMLSSPKFEDKTGYLPHQNIDTVFFSLNEGLKLIRAEIGEEPYLKLAALSDRMRAHFEADPEDENGESDAGRQLIVEMEDILKEVRRKGARRKA